MKRIGKLRGEVLCEVCLEGSSKQLELLELCLGWFTGNGYESSARKNCSNASSHRLEIHK